MFCRSVRRTYDDFGDTWWLLLEWTSPRGLAGRDTKTGYEPPMLPLVRIGSFNILSIMMVTRHAGVMLLKKNPRDLRAFCCAASEINVIPASGVDKSSRWRLKRFTLLNCGRYELNV